MYKVLFLMTLFSVSNSFAAEISVDRWANAIGGREKVGPIKAVYRESTIAVGGYEGSIKAWHTAGGKYRKEEQVATMSTIETFDGTNGALQRGTSAPHEMAGAELERARSTGLANWNSVFFAFFPERRKGSVTVEGDDTIVLKPDGGIDWRVTLDPQTSLPKTMVHKEGDRTVTVTFVSYETVDGIKFEKEIHRSNGDPRYDAVIRFTKTVINPAVDASLFTIEPRKVTETQRVGDTSGHWEGSVQAPTAEFKIELDLARNPNGELTGSLSSSAQHLKGLPLSDFAAEGNTLSFQVKGTPGERAFRGTLSPDGKSMSGDYTQGGQSIPFTLARTGDARMAIHARNPAIGKELEGTWNGTLDVDGKQSRLVLTMSNQSDGSATANVVKIEEGLEIPVATITQKESSLTLEFAAVGATYVGSLNSEGTELAGTLSEGSLRLPLTFRRTAVAESRK